MVEVKQNEADGKHSSNSRGTLFPDLAPYGKIRPMPRPKPPEEPELNEKKATVPIDRSAYEKRFQLSEKFLKTIVAANQNIDPIVKADPAPNFNSEREAKADTEVYDSAAKKRIRLPTLIVVLVLVICGLGAGSYLLFRAKAKAHKSSAGKSAVFSTAPAVATIPIYLPTNLPAGYAYNNDKKTVSPNVYSMSVTGPHKEYFYITEQTPPINNDFTPFDKQLTDPRSYVTPLGKITTGSTKSSFIVSIRTVKNTWVIINSPNTGSQIIIKPVIDSLIL